MVESGILPTCVLFLSVPFVCCLLCCPLVPEFQNVGRKGPGQHLSDEHGASPPAGVPRKETAKLLKRACASPALRSAVDRIDRPNHGTVSRNPSRFKRGRGLTCPQDMLFDRFTLPKHNPEFVARLTETIKMPTGARAIVGSRRLDRLR